MYISEIMTTAPEDERAALEAKVYRELEHLNIKFERVDNDAVESMAGCVEISEKLGAEIRKTIICSNRQKTDYYLVILPANKRFDSKLFAAMMRTARVSFASAEDMEALIGLTPGDNTTHIKFKTTQLINNFLPAEGYKEEMIML